MLTFKKYLLYLYYAKAYVNFVKNALIHGTEEMFHIYLCYVARGTRATRLEDRG